MIEVDTTTLEDSITADSPGARDASKDDNPYMVRATAIAAADGSETLSADDVTAMFSVDNVDDVAPLGPTNVSVTGVEATDSVFETAEDGSYTVGGLVDKYDDAVSSPVATFTVTPTADRKTYKSIRFVTDIENLVVGDATETAEGSGIFEVTVDVGTLADSETYLENGTYMFYALAFDEFGNEQADESETDGSKIVTDRLLKFSPLRPTARHRRTRIAAHRREFLCITRTPSVKGLLHLSLQCVLKLNVKTLTILSGKRLLWLPKAL